MTPRPETARRSATAVAAAAAIAVLAVWAISGWVIDRVSVDRGTFGDMFGAVNALFSGLAMAGVIFAILLQREELKLQRTELALTRRELEGQKEQLRAQNDTLKRQNFENTFFQLMRLHNDIVTSIDLRTQGEVTSQGRDCFAVFYRRFRQVWSRKQAEHLGTTERERIEKTYMAFYEGVESELGHYFRSLYNIVKFVDGSPIEAKRLYTNLVRAQLSTFELALLFYNSLSPLGAAKFKPLIEKYALLKMVPKDKLIDAAEQLELYEPGAYHGAA